MANHGFCINRHPTVFPSSVSIISVLETLLSFVISVETDEIVERMENFQSAGISSVFITTKNSNNAPTNIVFTPKNSLTIPINISR